MRHLVLIRPAAVVVTLVLLPASAALAQWPPDSFVNLKVLPTDIPQRELVDLMASFTRALGVRCTHCHVGTEGQPLSAYDFPADDKLAKRQARAMLEMVRGINNQYLSKLGQRADPPVKVECITCHRGTTQPRLLQDVLLQEYTAGGLTAVLASYRSLRNRYYGRFTYDFSEVPLADVAGRMWERDHHDDAVQLHAFNIEMNPSSVFAKRQYASLGLTLSFRKDGVERGLERYRELRTSYGADAFPEFVLDQVGTRLLNSNHDAHAVAVFKLNVDAFPRSADVHERLGAAYAKRGDRQLAIDSYKRSLELNPQNANARRSLEALLRP
jgi:tetratricopeptide (TPR) repeat protein